MEANHEAPETTAAVKKPLLVQASVFGVMLVLALVGMAVTMGAEQGAWEFWVFLLAVYGGVSVFWAWRRAKQNHEPVWRMVRAQVLHWGSVLVILAVLMLFERTEIVNRASASNAALLVLALACILAGVHFEWTFMLLGMVLAIMVVAIGYLEQYAVWIVMIPVILGSGWIYFQIHKRRASDRG